MSSRAHDRLVDYGLSDPDPAQWRRNKVGAKLSKLATEVRLAPTIAAPSAPLTADERRELNDIKERLYRLARSLRTEPTQWR